MMFQSFRARGRNRVARGGDVTTESDKDRKHTSVGIKLEDLEYGHSPAYDDHPPNSATALTNTVSRESSLNDRVSTQDEDYYYDNDYDPNFDENTVRVEDDSPYPEVRAAVANTDDPDMPTNTIRAWTLGIISAIIIPGVNQFMYFRYPTVAVGSLVAMLVSFPLGCAWGRVVPNWTIFGLPLNPGPFNIKEHVLITIMAGIGSRSAYATDIIAVQRVYYKQTYNFGYQWMLVMSTQLIGFSIGGINRKFLVDPPSMIWPANLVYCALFNTLHSQQYVGIGGRGGISRERFFTYVFIAATVYYFLPGYLFTALSVFSWVCWIAPHNVAVKQMFGYVSGMGMSVLTFDWSQISYIGSPLATPWWAAVNIGAGFIFFYWIITPILYYSDVWYSTRMPILSRNAYDNTGRVYNVTRILSNMTLDVTKYQEYSPLYIPTAFAVSYGLSFASITATLVHTLLYFSRQLFVKTRGALTEQPDIHARLMSKYPQVPQWWYLLIFLPMFAFGAISVEVWPTDMPVWALILALLIALFYVIPIGMIQAIANQQIGLNVITELIVGYALPGKPIAMMMFKTWGYISMSQALKFTSDFKLGHYMKIPPKTLFWCQIVASVVAGTVQLGVQAWMFSNIPDMCSPHQKDMFICPDAQVFYTASVLWGVIGPRLQFSEGRTYSRETIYLYKAWTPPDSPRSFLALMFFFLVGAILPLIPWVFLKKYPNSIFKYVNVPLFLGGTGLLPPATASNYVPWTVVAFVFQFFIRRRHFSWWAKYNYVLSAALDSSVALGALLIYFCLQFPRDGAIAPEVRNWWGNTVWRNTSDSQMLPLVPTAPGESFGPQTW